MPDNSEMVRKLNNSYYNSNSVKELFNKVISNIVTNFLTNLNRTTCKHSYSVVGEKWITNHLGEDNEISYTTEVWFHECFKCGKRTVTGDYYSTTKSQRGWIDLWLKNEKEKI